MLDGFNGAYSHSASCLTLECVCKVMGWMFTSDSLDVRPAFVCNKVWRMACTMMVALKEVNTFRRPSVMLTTLPCDG